MTKVVLKDIDVRYSGANASALHVGALEVVSGEIVAIVGVSGSGKSTLLRTVAGFIRRRTNLTSSSRWIHWLVSPNETVPLRGSVFFNGQDVSGVTPRVRQVAFATQALNLYPHMTAYENLAFPLEMAGKKSDEVNRRVEETAGKLHIGQLLKRRPAELSGGEQQRVALGKALIQDANVYLFDEPLSNIDAPLRASFRKELRTWLREPRRTSFYVTHDLDEAFAIADRVAVLHEGEMLQVAPPRELYKSPNSLAVAKLVWGGRTTVLSGEIDGSDRAPRLRVGSAVIDLDLPESVVPGSTVWVAAPREAFSLTSGEREGFDLLNGQVIDVRFAAASYVVDVKGPSFSVEVAVNGCNLPSLGNPVTVSVNPSQLRLFPKDPHEQNGSEKAL